MTDDKKLTELEGRLRTTFDIPDIGDPLLINPDGLEAADAIHTLRQRNARLVEGLRPFAGALRGFTYQPDAMAIVVGPHKCDMHGGLTLGDFRLARTLIEDNSNGR